MKPDLALTRNRLQQYLIHTRNSSITQSLMRQYRHRVARGNLQIFCVSNSMYWDKRYAPKVNADPYLNLSGIPQVRKHCIGIVASSQLRESTTYISRDTDALLSDIQLWVLSGAGSISAERKVSIRRALNRVEAKLKLVRGGIGHL